MNRSQNHLRQRAASGLCPLAVRSGFVGHRSPRVAKKSNRARPEVSQSGSWRRLADDAAVFCPSQDARGTTLGQLLGQINDVLSTAYAICPRISQKKDQTTFSILNSPFSVLLETACHRQWPRIATSFTAWFRTDNEFPEAAWPPTCLCRVLRTLQHYLGTVTQGCGRGGLTLGYYLASPTGTT